MQLRESMSSRNRHNNHRSSRTQHFACSIIHAACRTVGKRPCGLLLQQGAMAADLCARARPEPRSEETTREADRAPPRSRAVLPVARTHRDDEGGQSACVLGQWKGACGEGVYV